MARTDSIEAYARLYHQYHPVILKMTLALQKQHPEKMASLFSSTTDLMLFFNAIKNAKVIILRRGDIASGRRAPAKRKNPCLVHFTWYPQHILRYFTARQDFLPFARFVRSVDAATRAEADFASGKQRTGKTPCFMLADHPIWARGVLNKAGRHVGNTFDLTTFEGFVFFMHEAFHVMQWYRSPLALLFQYVKAVVKSLALSDGHITWAHELIDFEVEAMIFHNKIWAFLASWPGGKEFLATFKKYR
jgi:hypothetical protein